MRIDHTYKAQVVGQIDAANTQVKQYEKQLDSATDEQLAGIIKNYQQQAPQLKITNKQELKENLLTDAKQKQNQAQKQLQTRFKAQRKTLFKTTAKWSMTAILTGTCFALIWKYTIWARVGY